MAELQAMQATVESLATLALEKVSEVVIGEEIYLTAEYNEIQSPSQLKNKKKKSSFLATQQPPDFDVIEKKLLLILEQSNNLEQIRHLDNNAIMEIHSYLINVRGFNEADSQIIIEQLDALIYSAVTSNDKPLRTQLKNCIQRNLNVSTFKKIKSNIERLS